MDAFFRTVFAAGPPGLGLRPRPGSLDAASVRKAVSAQVRPSAKSPTPDRIRLLEGISLLWNDCWKEAHEIAQAREGERDFDLLHAILHRREGDYPNAAYWFREVGKHPCYLILEKRIAPFLDGESAAVLMPDGRWSALAFIDRVRGHARESGETAGFPERVQAEEFRAFAEWLLAY
ncbi:MAG: hypothetical protein JWO30_545 [Fibrobacteres bacterium]|nr:hypothetical protein [Fibrobacterota bacterium]